MSSGEVTLTKVRALTRVATPSCEQELLELAELLTASQLERALRAFRRIQDADVLVHHPTAVALHPEGVELP